MRKYENGIWKLLNVDELSKRGECQIDYQKCIGATLKYVYKPSNIIYEIKILDYIKGYKDENNKQLPPNFKVKYVYLKETEYEENIERVINCNSLIKGANIGSIIPSQNQWVKKDNYWIGIDIKGRDFSFNTNDKEVEYNILHSTWCIDSNGYVLTGNLNNTKQLWQMHRAIYFNCDKKEADKNIHMCIDHINNDRVDNRIKNLRLVTKSENNKNRIINNECGLIGLKQLKKGYYSQFMINKYNINTKVKYDLEEAKLDNLIAQQYLGYKHNEEQFYKLGNLSKDRIKEVVDNLDRQIENNKSKVKKEKEYSYDYIKKDELIGIKTFKRNGEENPICWIDKDFGIIKKNNLIVYGNIHINNGYFLIKNYSLNVYVMTKTISIQNYRGYNFHIDHINHKRNENYRNNLEIVTIRSNHMNKKNKGYTSYKRESGIKYMVQYANKWKYFDLYIGGLKNPTFNTEEEAITEYKRRKEIVDKYRFRIGWQGSIEANIKALDEVIDFTEEHKLDLDSAYIVWRGLDSLENIKNFLESIDK